MEKKFMLFRHEGFQVIHVYDVHESHVELYIDAIKKGQFPKADKYELYDRESKQSIYIK